MKKITLFLSFVFILVSFAQVGTVLNPRQEAIKKDLVKDLEIQKQQTEKKINPELRKRLSNCMRHYYYIPEVREYIYITGKDNPDWMIKNVVLENVEQDKTKAEDSYDNIAMLKIIASNGERTFAIKRREGAKLENAKKLAELWKDPEYFDAVCTARAKLFKNMETYAISFDKGRGTYQLKGKNGGYFDYADFSGKPGHTTFLEWSKLWSYPPKCEYTLWGLDLDYNDDYYYNCVHLYEKAFRRDLKEDEWNFTFGYHRTFYILSDEKDFKKGVALNFQRKNNLEFTKANESLRCSEEYLYHRNKDGKADSKVPFNFKKLKTFKMNDYMKDSKYVCVEGYLF